MPDAPMGEGIEARMMEYFRDQRRMGVGQEFDFRIGHDISQMTKDAGIELDTKGVGSAALLYAVFGLKLDGMKVQANDYTCAKFTGPSLADPATKVVYDSAAIDHIPDTEQGIWLKKFLTTSQYARGW
ncbi:hypothetical protein QYM36_013920 [Artemia franciscana]|uniref:Uncharacterized protein n=1 Tax=Artemia franciscana TaxID=6661 RepID=A0AA88HNK5_ARTSF|nr:hypothetical protein QYM36_013920 [Artemia franciscana]